jgi:RNA polymerase sigma factor (sigma-70 family)
MNPGPHEPDDELRGLAVRLRGGDTDALREILTLLGPVVIRRLASRFGRHLNPDDLEDVLSTALLRMWLRRERYDPDLASLPHWFYLLARNAAVDLLRTKARQHEVAGLPQEAAQPAPAPARKGVLPIPPGLPTRLASLLQGLTEEDRDILLTFAESEGEGPWAAEVGTRLGVSANSVSARKKRLLERLRRELLADAPAEQGGEERAVPMAVNREWVTGLEKFRPELRQVADDLLVACARAAQHGREPRLRFAREWNWAIEQGKRENDPERLSAMQRSWAWMEGLLQAGRGYRDQVVKFSRRCREDARLAKSELFAWPEELVAERLQRGIVGVADAVERRMPPQARQERRGEVLLVWLSESPGPLDAEWGWVGPPAVTSSPAAPRLLPVARASMQRYAELPLAEGEAFADRLLHDLQGGEIDLPDFRRVRGDKSQTLLRWQPKPVESVPLSRPLRERERLKEPDEFPHAVELELWKRHPEAARAVDEALCAAAEVDYRRATGEGTGKEAPAPRGKPEEGPAVEQVVRALQELTGRPAEEVVLLLTPLLERRVLQDPAAQNCARYLNALAFLWSQLSSP